MWQSERPAFIGGINSSSWQDPALLAQDLLDANKSREEEKDPPTDSARESLTFRDVRASPSVVPSTALRPERFTPLVRILQRMW